MFRSGQMGQVRKVIVEYLQDFLVFPHEKHGMKQAVWRTDPAQAGLGGTLGDAGVHCINLLEYVIGERVSAICADKCTFLPDRKLDEDVNIMLSLSGGGKGMMTVSQIATGEENALRLRVYAEHGAVLWDQENPNELRVYRYGEPRQTLTRGHAEYLSAAATDATRVPTGHTEGYLEAFATIYVGVVRAIRRHLAGEPLAAEEYQLPSVRDGLRGMQFIAQTVASAEAGSVWMPL
jgi:predicted dehydrogenase